MDIHSSPIEGLFLHAGGAYNDSEFVGSDAKTQGLRPVDSGAKLTGTWYINYVIPQGSLRGFSVGFGGSHYGKDYITNSTSGAFYTNAYSLYNALRITSLTKNIGMEVEEWLHQGIWDKWYFPWKLNSK